MLSVRTSSLARDAVLVDVKGVKHVGIAIFPLTSGNCSVEIERRSLSSRRPKFAVLLELKGTEERIVPQIDSRRLLRVCMTRIDALVNGLSTSRLRLVSSFRVETGPYRDTRGKTEHPQRNY